MSRKIVVITGMGLVTPLGGNVGENLEGVLAQRTGIASWPESKAAGETPYLGKIRSLALPEDIPARLSSQMRFLNRGSLLGFAAAREAVAGSHPDFSGIPPERRALFIASGDLTRVGYDFMYPATTDATGGRWEDMDFEKLNRSAMNKVNPFFLLESIYNNSFSFLSAFLGFSGPNTSIASLSPCGGHALELAWRTLTNGEADTALAVGCGNWISEVPVYEMEMLGILSRCRDGEKSYRPFDRGRDGFIPGEGAAAILMETSESAEARGAEVLAVIHGFGNSIEPPAGRGFGVPLEVCRQSMQDALDEAGYRAQDLGFICPHGSGTPKGDRSELRSIVAVLGENAGDIPLCALKPHTGHMAAASDIAEVVLSIKAAAAGIVPGMLNFLRPDAEFAHLNMSNASRPLRNRLFLSTSYGVLGESSSIIVEAMESRRTGDR